MQNSITKTDIVDWFTSSFNNIRYLSNSADNAYEIIWKHVRHCIDHIDAVLNSAGIIDYPWTRTRGSEIETSFEEFNNRAMEIIDSLKSNDFDLNKDISVIDLNENWEEIKMVSTIGRELYYMIQHTIHHLAFLKLTLEGQWIEVKNPDLWKTPSTLAYEESEKS